MGLPQRTVSALRSHRKRQLGASSEWQENGLVFASKHGKPLDAQNVVNRFFKPLLQRAGLFPPFGSTISGTRAYRSSPNVANPSVTCKPSPVTPPQLLPSNATHITMTLRQGAPPTLWATSSQTVLRPLFSLATLDGQKHRRRSGRGSWIVSSRRTAQYHLFSCYG